MLRGPKHSEMEVIAPKEEEEEFTVQILMIILSSNMKF
jgi:hypothetical protein